MEIEEDQRKEHQMEVRMVAAKVQQRVPETELLKVLLTVSTMELLMEYTKVWC